jgi:hypothetical protein
MSCIRRFSELSAPRRALIRMCQAIDYGQIIDLHVRDCEPVFNPAPTVLRDIKLDGESTERPECELNEFTLRNEVCRLLQLLDEAGTGRIQRIEVRAGIPRRIVLESRFAEVLG